MTPPSSPRAGRSTVSAAGEPRLSFGEILSVVGEWWDGCARADHAVGINLSNPGYRQAVFEGLARLIHSKAGAAASPAGPEAVPQSEPPDPLATVHVAEFTEDGYGLQHPASCRPNLIDCRYNTYLTSLFQPEREPGRYVMTLAGEHAEYTPVEEVGAVPQSEREGLRAALERAIATFEDIVEMTETGGDIPTEATIGANQARAALASPPHPDEE